MGASIPGARRNPLPGGAVYASTETDIHCPANVSGVRGERLSLRLRADGRERLRVGIGTGLMGFITRRARRRTRKDSKNPTFEVAMAKVPVFRRSGAGAA